MSAEANPLLTEEQRARVRGLRTGTDRIHPDMQGLLDILDYVATKGADLAERLRITEGQRDDYGERLDAANLRIRELKNRIESSDHLHALKDGELVEERRLREAAERRDSENDDAWGELDRVCSWYEDMPAAAPMRDYILRLAAERDEERRLREEAEGALYESHDQECCYSMSGNDSCAYCLAKPDPCTCPICRRVFVRKEREG